MNGNSEIKVYSFLEAEKVEGETKNLDLSLQKIGKDNVVPIYSPLFKRWESFEHSIYSPNSN